MAVLRNVTRRTVLAQQCIVANGFWLRLRGLMFRRAFGPFDGLWLTRTNAIHMFWVWFPIDLVWLDRDQTVVKVTRSLGPWRLDAARGAVAVIELPVGTIDRTATAPGDRLATDQPTPSGG